MGGANGHFLGGSIEPPNPPGYGPAIEIMPQIFHLFFSTEYFNCNHQNFRSYLLALYFPIFLFCAGPDIIKDVQKLKDAMHKRFRIEGHPPIYNPEKFQEFWKENGCITLYNTLFAAQTTDCQSSDRHDLARIRTVAIIYRLVYGLSQWANYYQRDYGTYLAYSGASQNALETARNMSDSTSAQLFGKKIEEITKNITSCSKDSSRMQ